MRLGKIALLLGPPLFLVLPLPAQPKSSSRACDANAVPLRLANVSNKVRGEIMAAVSHSLSDSILDRRSARDIALNSWISFPQLSPTDRTLVVTAGPENPNNGVSNRQIWVFRMVGRHAELVLQDWALLCDFNPVSDHSGMADLRLHYKDSGSQGSVTLFQFDGRQYRRSSCSRSIADENGTIKETAPAPCGVL